MPPTARTDPGFGRMGVRGAQRALWCASSNDVRNSSATSTERGHSGVGHDWTEGGAVLEEEAMGRLRRGSQSGTLAVDKAFGHNLGFQNGGRAAGDGRRRLGMDPPVPNGAGGRGGYPAPASTTPSAPTTGPR